MTTKRPVGKTYLFANLSFILLDSLLFQFYFNLNHLFRNK